MPEHKEYRDQWVAAGYDSRMGSAVIVQPPPTGRLRVYYFTSAEFALSNISLSRIKVSRFSNLNDPFELLALNSKKSYVRNIGRLLRDEYDNSTGLICFSKNWISPPMWSHYAAIHRGICLGFDVERAAVSDVIYADERMLESLPESSGLAGVSEALRKKLSRTKSHHWAYEGEARMIFPLSSAVKEGNLHFKSFGLDLQLAEVILGVFCELPLHSIRQLVSSLHPGAVAFRARLAWKSFSVVPMESTIDEELERMRAATRIVDAAR